MFRVIFSKKTTFIPLKGKTISCLDIKTFSVKGIPWFLFYQESGDKLEMPASLIKFKVFRKHGEFIWAHDPFVRRRLNVELY